MMNKKKEICEFAAQIIHFFFRELIYIVWRNNNYE